MDVERLLRTPAAYARLRDAVRSDCQAGEQVEAVIVEGMRSRPVIPIIGRRVSVPWRLGEYVLPAQSAVSISILLLHHREDLYPQPFVFRPERWLDRKPGTYEWIPFGGGTRRCLGAQLAMAEQRVVLATMARRLELAGRPTGAGACAAPQRDDDPGARNPGDPHGTHSDGRPPAGKGDRLVTTGWGRGGPYVDYRSG